MRTTSSVVYELRAYRNGRCAAVLIPTYPEPVAGFGPPEFLDQVHAERLLAAYKALHDKITPRYRPPKALAESIAAMK